MSFSRWGRLGGSRLELGKKIEVMSLMNWLVDFEFRARMEEYLASGTRRVLCSLSNVRTKRNVFNSTSRA
jgi:hypothetical protein